MSGPQNDFDPVGGFVFETPSEAPVRSPAVRPSLLSDIIEGVRDGEAASSHTKRKNRGSQQLDQFLTESDSVEQLRMWLGSDQLDQLASAKWRDVAGLIKCHIAHIDGMLSDQVNAILHHPSFQKLESLWRGVCHLLECKSKVSDSPVQVRILNTTWGEIRRDFDRATDFDQSQLFRLVYDEEFGMSGGSPYGAILADFDIHPRPSQAHPHDDIMVMKSLSRVAAASFCPIFVNASPAMFGLNHFDEMQHSMNLSRIQGDLDYLDWNQFRETEDARFIGVVMPRMLMRRPYDHHQIAKTGFMYDETGMTRRSYCWGGAVFGIGEVLIRAFGQNRWLADIRGAQRGVDGGGIVFGPTTLDFTTDSPQVAPKPFLDVMINDFLERQLADLGFMSLSSCPGTTLSAFYSCPSAQKPKAYTTTDANANSKISSMLNYMLCVSRFAHYIKVIGRQKVGGFQDAESLQQMLHNWLIQFVTSDSDASIAVKGRRPLRAAEVMVRPDPAKPGTYTCTMLLSPHYELDDMNASIKLVAEIATPSQ